jgi:hypothetical protein
MGISESHRQQYINFILILGLTIGIQGIKAAQRAGFGPLE